VDSAPDGERRGGDGGKASASFDCLKGADTVETQRWTVSLMERDAEAVAERRHGRGEGFFGLEV
jgi:hypothetical protein